MLAAQDLERHAAVELLVVRLEDHAHAAGADLPQQPEVTEALRRALLGIEQAELDELVESPPQLPGERRVSGAEPLDVLAPFGCRSFEAIDQQAVYAVVGHWGTEARARVSYLAMSAESGPRPDGRAFRSDRTESLVHAAVRREPGALDRLLEAHLPNLRAFVRLQVDERLRLRESQSDLVQSVCREVLEDLPGYEYRGEGSFRAWLFTAALNKVRQKGEFHRAHKRDVARERRIDGERDGGDAAGNDLYSSLCSLGPTPSQHAIANEQSERLERAMDRLPADDREMLLLARVVDLSRQEIGDRMGLSEKTVHNRIGRAGVRLLAALEDRR